MLKPPRTMYTFVIIKLQLIIFLRNIIKKKSSYENKIINDRTKKLNPLQIN